MSVVVFAILLSYTVMSSGFGQQGGRGRCFVFFQDFVKCYSQADHPQQCRLQFEDYDECLWHKKEIARMKLIEGEWYKHNPEKAPTESSLPLPRFKPGQFAKLHGFGN